MFETYTLSALCSPLFHLPINPNTGLPVFALAGRLLAYATSVPSARPGPEGLGSLVTAQSTRRPQLFSSSNELSQATQSLSMSETTQGAILASAVEIGGGVARGVWAGIKMGAKAANQARNNQLARSAPVEASGSLADIESEEHASTESRSLEEEDILTNTVNDVREREETGGEWVKIVDLQPRARQTSSASFRGSKVSQTSGHFSLSSSTLPQPDVIAHFRSPPSKSHVPTSTEVSRNRTGAASRSHIRPIALLSFNPLGTQLLVAPDDGKAQHLYEIHPAGAGSSDQGTGGEVWHLYELRRGSTSAKVIQINWGRDGRWIGVQTGRGTIRELILTSRSELMLDVFPINPTGGPASARTHVSTRPLNPQELYPLSTVISAATRLRPRRLSTTPLEDVPYPTEGPGNFIFADLRRDPQDKQAVCQDVIVIRLATAQIELCRFAARLHIPQSPPKVPGHRKASALTEMMRVKAFGQGPDLEVRKSVKARWSIPIGAELEGQEYNLDLRDSCIGSIALGPR